MPIFLLTSGEYSNQLLADGEIGTLGRNAVIASISSIGVLANGNNIDLRVQGQILTMNTNGIYMAGANNYLSIAGTGIVDSSAAGINATSCILIYENAIGNFFNAGWVSGNSSGAFMRAANIAAKININNSGTILGEDVGLVVSGIGAVVVNNSGTILGTTHGITAYTNGALEAAALTLTNSGTVEGQLYAIRSGSGADKIVNRGTVNGNVVLNAGNDSFDNSSGTVYGSIDLGLGNDTYIAGLSIETVIGGSGADTLNFTASQTGVTVALDGSIANSGTAAGDNYSGFETLRGSNFGGDRFIGTAANETFWGNGGADTLSGAAGVDQLIGGAGKDLLSGGAGNDSFLFYALSEVGDSISDFGNAGTNDDYIKIKASGFGGGLVAGALSATQFIVRADHAAQDSNDRFIFNTVDHSLWFDRDGNGAAAAVMVADLQNTSAIMTAADILLI
jgi:Ca2+-binding RTX toxin-like protein